MPSVAYVTYAEDPADPDPDIDLPLALDALRATGLHASAVRWDDPDVDWAGFDLALVRSPWDYVRRHGEFLGWACRTSAATRLANPLDVLVRTTDKRYLRDLAAAGVPVVPTRWLEPGQRPDLVGLAWPRVVVKPAVSAGARDTIVTSDRCAAEAHADAVLAVPLTGELLAAVDRVLDAQPGSRDLAYARVDLVRDQAGRWALMELELTEPLLFLGYAAAAPERFAAVVSALLA